jgi:hypothetical protein
VKKWLLLAVGIAALTVIGLRLHAAHLPHQVQGTVVVSYLDETAIDGRSIGASCQDYNLTAVSPGTQVAVTDEDGKTLAVSRLGPGRVVSSTGSFVSCGYQFSAVVPESHFYAFQVGNGNKVTFSKDQLERQSWTAGVAINDLSGIG